jgi:hypothetical protein
MYQFNNLTTNVPNVQTFNADSTATYQSQSRTLYTYQGINVSGVPTANGQLFQRTSTSLAYFKIDNTGATAPTPQVSGLISYGTFAAGSINGWLNANITAVTDSGTYWLVSVGTAFVGILATSSTFNFDIQTKMDILPWQTWTKPNDAMLIHILCIGGGGGGGSGKKDSSVINRFGGGGGGSAAVTSMFVPAFLIPDTLYVQVALGGVGGAAQTINTVNGNNGTASGTSYVALYPSYTGTEYGNLLLSAIGGFGGGGGFNVGSGRGGDGGTSTSVGATSPFYLGLGQFTSTVGQAGSSSSSTAAPTALTISGITSGGSAGGAISGLNAEFAGGAINSPSALIPYLTSLAGGAVSASFTSITNSGYAVKKPLMWVGGAGSGGSISNAQSVPKAGDGAIGSGGGGGGASNGGSGGITNSGAGGKGGDGIVIITSYSI